MKILSSSNLDEFFEKIDLENITSIDEIVSDVKNNGDGAVLKYCKTFNEGDFNVQSDLVVSDDEIKSAYKKVDKKTLDALNVAISNVKDFATKQLATISELKTSPNNSKESYLGHKIVPLESVLCYVPGGNYPLMSSAIMTVVPALVAGVKNVYVTSPKISPEVIVASHLAGASKIFKIGGAQAIAAFAYGTNSIPKVNKIVGPGNKYVTYAKKIVHGECGIDFLAGPSEVLIVADKTANPSLIAADILAQCEHDKDARGYLVSIDEKLIYNVIDRAREFLKTLKTADIARVSFEKSCAVIVSDINQAIEISNKKAPEHLELVFEGAKDYIDLFKNYGSMFIGANCAEVFGDYCSGTNHVLPTNQVASYKAGLSVFDFIKIQTYQYLTKDYAVELSKTASILAEKEGLFAHKLASDLRSKDET